MTARQAAENAGFCGELHLLEELYLSGPTGYLEAIYALDESEDIVLLVGHNPGLEDLVTFLTGRRVTLAPASLAHVEMPAGSWPEVGMSGSGRLVALRNFS